MKHVKFAAAINCMDGRVQIPVIGWIKTKFAVDYVDVITEPAPNRVIAENKEKPIIDSIKRRVEISIGKHNSKIIVITAHHDCAGNPVDKDKQFDQILSSIKIIESWNFNVPVIGLWINENWEVERVK